MFFKKKKYVRQRSAKERERDELIGKILGKYNTISRMPGKEHHSASLISKEYINYKEEELVSKKAAGFYEKIVSALGVVKIKPDKGSKEKLDNAISFADMHVTSEQVFSASLVLCGFMYFFSFMLFFVSDSLFFRILLFLFPAIAAYHFMTRPMSFAEGVRIRTGGSLIMAVLYMIVYMKSTPNIEGAVRFAAKNITGRLSSDLKELLWKVEIGMSSTVESALAEYALTWSSYNRDFVESVQLLRESMLEPSNTRRDILLDKAVDVVLIGTNERMKRYARNLETPIMILHGVGVLLPVLGMIALPLLSIFMASELKGLPFYLFFGYNMVLPLGVYYFMIEILSKRPSTHSRIEISMHPDYTPLEIVRIQKGKRKLDLPVWPIALIVTFALTIPGILFTYRSNFFSAQVIQNDFFSMLASISVVAGIAIGAAMYFYLTSFQKIKLRDTIVKTEDEFEDALFSLGNRLSGGTPVEKAIFTAHEDTKELGISGLFEISLKNMNRLNMTFRESLFDKRYGALKYYPSSLIHAIMNSVSISVDKGTKAASLAMLTIARYLRDLHTTQEKIEDILSAAVSQMQFQAYVLVPVISGVVVAISDLIIRILARLSKTFDKLQSDMPGDVGGMSLDIFGFDAAMPSELLQLVVGVYVIQILIILGMFMTRIEYGDDRIKENDALWKVIITGISVYFLVFVLVSAVFRPLLSGMGAFV